MTEAPKNRPDMKAVGDALLKAVAPELSWIDRAKAPNVPSRVNGKSIDAAMEIINRALSEAQSIHRISGRVVESALEAAFAEGKQMQVAKLVDRFLGWPLPRSVCSDLCVADRDYKFPRRGTNLLGADEARQMIEYLFQDGPKPESEVMPNEAVYSGPYATGPGITTRADLPKLAADIVDMVLDSINDDETIQIAEDFYHRGEAIAKVLAALEGEYDVSR